MNRLCLPRFASITRGGVAAAVRAAPETARRESVSRECVRARRANARVSAHRCPRDSRRARHAELHIETLEELEIAAHDGRLERMPRIGPRRAAALRATLAGFLGRAGVGAPLLGRRAPTVELLLDVDEQYRREAAADRLPKIAPRRFNPQHLAWPPILHTDRDGWHFTALYSNTAKAHELRKTHDWVVVYFYDSDHREGRQTIVTETRGPLEGERVVRGREAECATY